mmetsp:Transcript_15010/g.35576  ORF Transcript_15010/g.35576 Transcript_15010/m.35576 type:complete len:219 (-) Transcript_15010:2049-2705(-)
MGGEGVGRHCRWNGAPPGASLPDRAVPADPHHPARRDRGRGDDDVALRSVGGDVEDGSRAVSGLVCDCNQRDRRPGRNVGGCAVAVGPRFRCLVCDGRRGWDGVARERSRGGQRGRGSESQGSWDRECVRGVQPGGARAAGRECRRRDGRCGAGGREVWDAARGTGGGRTGRDGAPCRHRRRAACCGRRRNGADRVSGSGRRCGWRPARVSAGCARAR